MTRIQKYRPSPLPTVMRVTWTTIPAGPLIPFVLVYAVGA
jgi:hypothetical protein